MPNEPEELKKIIAQQAAQIEQVMTENKFLQAKVQALLKQLFGRKSEKLDSRQLELIMQIAEGHIPDPDDDPPPTDPAPRKKKRTRSKLRLPENLEVKEQTIEPDEVLENPENFKRIGEEVTNELDVIPQQYFIRRTIRPKYVDRTDRNRPPMIAPLPARVIDQGMAGPGLLADIVIKKYRDHLPLYRQEQIAKVRGLELSRKTMVDWVEKVAEWLKPIYNHVGHQLRAGPYMQIDETPIRYCGVEGGGSKKGYLWVYNVPNGDVLYEWHTGRGADCLEGMLTDFSGTVQRDGYISYETFTKGKEHIRLAACWAHARRKFFEAQEEAPGVAGWLLHQIGLLYRVERELRENKASHTTRQRVRSMESRMIYERIGKALKIKLARYLPQSEMRKAIAYTLGLWGELGMYLEDGRLEIDNNLVENAIRPTAVGKKNWLFFGSPNAGQRSAIIYTLLACCKRRDIDPWEYLTDVLTRLPNMKMQDVASLAPANWLAARQQADQAA